MEKVIFVEDFKKESKKYIDNIILFSIITIANCIVYALELVDFRYFIITTLVMLAATILFVFLFFLVRKYKLLVCEDYIKVKQLFRNIVIKKSSIEKYVFIKKNNIFTFTITTTAKDVYTVYTSYGEEMIKYLDEKYLNNLEDN